MYPKANPWAGIVLIRHWLVDKGPSKKMANVLCQVGTVRFYQAPHRLDSIPVFIIYSLCELDNDLTSHHFIPLTAKWG